MTGERTLYDRQLTDRFGSLTGFLVQQNSPDPSDWGAVLDYQRIAACEATLDRLRSRFHHLVALPDLTAKEVDHLTGLVADMNDAVTVREEHTVFLRLALDLPAALPTPSGDDPYADLQPNPLPHQRPAPSAARTPPAATSDADDRVVALVGSLDRLTRAEHDRDAHPELRTLATVHRLTTSASTVATGIQTHLATLTDGRWYPDGAFMAVLDGNLTALGEAVAQRDSARRRLAAALGRLESAARNDPHLRAALAGRTPAPFRPDTARPSAAAPTPPPPAPPGTPPPPRSR
jgi:hypothetical protein